MSGILNPIAKGGGLLDADYPSDGVLLPHRITEKRPRECWTPASTAAPDFLKEIKRLKRSFVIGAKLVATGQLSLAPIRLVGFYGVGAATRIPIRPKPR
jgi:hypothetical protein